MNFNFKKTLIAVVTFLGGIYFFLEFILPEYVFGVKFGTYHEEISQGFQVVGVMAIGLGIINILKVHGGNLLRTGRNWSFSLALILGLSLTVFIDGSDFLEQEVNQTEQKKITNLTSFVETIEKDKKENNLAPEPRLKTLTQYLEEIKDSVFNNKGNKDLEQAILLSSRLASNYEDKEEIQPKLIKALKQMATEARIILSKRYEETSMKKASSFLFEAFYVPLGAAMFSLLGYYIANAAFRSFRIRSLEAVIMMVAALIVMLGQIPHGILYISEDMPLIRIWLLKNINGPAFRAINFCALIAGLAMAVRMWLSLEKSPLSGDSSKEKADG